MSPVVLLQDCEVHCDDFDEKALSWTLQSVCMYVCGFEVLRSELHRVDFFGELILLVSCAGLICFGIAQAAALLTMAPVREDV